MPKSTLLFTKTRRKFLLYPTMPIQMQRKTKQHRRRKRQLPTRNTNRSDRSPLPNTNDLSQLTLPRRLYNRPFLCKLRRKTKKPRRPQLTRPQSNQNKRMSNQKTLRLCLCTRYLLRCIRQRPTSTQPNFSNASTREPTTTLPLQQYQPNKQTKRKHTPHRPRPRKHQYTRR